MSLLYNMGTICKLQAYLVFSQQQVLLRLMLSLTFRSQLVGGGEKKTHLLSLCMCNHQINEAFPDNLIKFTPEVSQVLSVSSQHHKQEKSLENTSSCVGGQLKTRSLSLICQHNNQSTDKFNSVTLVLTGQLLLETGRRKKMRKCWVAAACVTRLNSEKGIFSHIFPLLQHTQTLFRPGLPVRAKDTPVDGCIATCAQLRWLAGPWQGVSWFVRSELCDYSLTRRLLDWHSLERSANHTRYKNSPRGWKQ